MEAAVAVRAASSWKTNEPVAAGVCRAPFLGRLHPDKLIVINVKNNAILLLPARIFLMPSATFLQPWISLHPFE